MKRGVIGGWIAMILAGCACGPSGWATSAEMELRCGQTVEQVAAITGKSVRAVDVPDSRRTHLARDDNTDLWLVFDGKGLRSVQVAWKYQLKRVAMSPRLELCPTSRN